MSGGKVGCELRVEIWVLVMIMYVMGCFLFYFDLIGKNLNKKFSNGFMV